MTIHVYPEQDPRELVIALHCSGGTPNQWNRLAEYLDQNVSMFETPKLPDSVPPEYREKSRSYTLAAEAAPVVERLRLHGRPAHLVGHSYGGALALHIATNHPHLVASLSLYEPATFHLLAECGKEGRRALAELTALADRIRKAIGSGEDREAARLFVTYWSGSAAWESMGEEARQAIFAYLPKGRLEFEALVNERAPRRRLRELRVPTLIINGSAEANPARMAAQELTEALTVCRARVIDGAGHMGPMTHGESVAQAIVSHIGDIRERSAVPMRAPAISD